MTTYYATIKHHSIIGRWIMLRARTLRAAKIEATRDFRAGYHGDAIHLVGLDVPYTNMINDMPSWIKIIPSGKWRWSEGGVIMDEQGVSYKRFNEVCQSHDTLLGACKDIVKAYDVKMGESAKRLRIEVVRDAVNKAEKVTS